MGERCLSILALLGSAHAFQPRIGLTPRAHHISVPRVTALAPSGVDGLPLAVQTGAFVATFASLGASAYGIDKAYSAIKRPADWWDVWELGAALLLGLIFVTAGRSHFTMAEAFIASAPHKL